VRLLQLLLTFGACRDLRDRGKLIAAKPTLTKDGTGSIPGAEDQRDLSSGSRMGIPIRK
jgi:hypothetical protein